jgi:hypothetical protein
MAGPVGIAKNYRGIDYLNYATRIICVILRLNKAFGWLDILK